MYDTTHKVDLSFEFVDVIRTYANQDEKVSSSTFRLVRTVNNTALQGVSYSRRLQNYSKEVVEQ